MVFYDSVLNTEIETKESSGTCTACVNGRIFLLPLSANDIKNCPEWVKQDVIRLLVRKILRRETVNRLAALIVPNMPKEQ